MIPLLLSTALATSPTHTVRVTAGPGASTVGWAGEAGAEVELRTSERHGWGGRAVVASDSELFEIAYGMVGLEPYRFWTAPLTPSVHAYGSVGVGAGLLFIEESNGLFSRTPPTTTRTWTVSAHATGGMAWTPGPLELGVYGRVRAQPHGVMGTALLGVGGRF